METTPKIETENGKVGNNRPGKSSIKQQAIDEVILFVNEHLKKNPDATVISLCQLPIAYEHLSNHHLDYPSRCMIKFLKERGCRIFKKNEDPEGWHRKLKLNGNRTLIQLRPVNQNYYR